MQRTLVELCSVLFQAVFYAWMQLESPYVPRLWQTISHNVLSLCRLKRYHNYPNKWLCIYKYGFICVCGGAAISTAGSQLLVWGIKSKPLLCLHSFGTFFLCLGAFPPCRWVWLLMSWTVWACDLRLTGMLSRVSLSCVSEMGYRFPLTLN